MYLYYVLATEAAKGRKEAKQDTHAILAKDDEQLELRCSKLFISHEKFTSKHKLNKDWN